MVAGDADVELLDDLFGGVRIAGELVHTEEEQVGEQLTHLFVQRHVGKGFFDPGDLAFVKVVGGGCQVYELGHWLVPLTSPWAW